MRPHLVLIKGILYTVKEQCYEVHIRLPLDWKPDIERWKKEEDRPLNWLVVDMLNKKLQQRKRKRRTVLVDGKAS